MTGTLSEIRHEILRVEWTIHDFLSLQPESVGSFHESTLFRLSDDDSWCFKVYPYGDEVAKNGIGLHLRHGTMKPSSSSTICTLAVKKTDGSLHWKKTFTWRFKGSENYGYPRMLLRSDLLRKKDEFLLEDALTFCCILRKVPPAEALDSLSLDLKKLQVSSEQSDVTVMLKSKEYRAHKAVLAARSDVFASALTHDMSEKETGIIKIEDCDSDSFQDFLQYLYTGRADINEGNVFHLYRTADKYLVGELKSQCVAFLMDSMSVDNFCDAVTLAHDHGEKGLEKFCEIFFTNNTWSILGTSNWTSLMRSQCDAADKLLKYTASKTPN